MKAKFESYSRDLFWSVFIAGSTLRWTGYNDDYWWNSVAPTDDFQVREHEGKKYRLNPRTSEITPVGDQPTPPTEVPEAGPSIERGDCRECGGEGGTVKERCQRCRGTGIEPGPVSSAAPQATGGTVDSDDEFDNEAPTPDTSAFVRELGHYPNLVNGHKQRRKALIKWARRLERQRDEARRALDDLRTGKQAVLPQTLEHARNLYTVAVACLKTFGQDPESDLATLRAENERLTQAHNDEMHAQCASYENRIKLILAENAALRADLEKAKAERLSFMQIGAEKANLALSLDTANEELESKLTAANAQLAEVSEAESKLSDAYVRLRHKIPGALDTPFAPTGEQVWETTERALDILRQQLSQARSDTERLDWIENNGAGPWKNGNKIWSQVLWSESKIQEHLGRTARAAIDTARTGKKE
jgi:hypothetical protein